MEPTQVRIVSVKSNKSITTVRIFFRAHETSKTTASKQSLAYAFGEFDLLYKRDSMIAYRIYVENNDWFEVKRYAYSAQRNINDFDNLDKFWSSFVSAVKSENKEVLSEMVNYPFTFYNGREYTIQNKNDFKKHYTKIFTKLIKESVIKGLIGFPKIEDDVDSDLKKDEILLYSPVKVITDSDLQNTLLFKKVANQFKMCSFFSFG